jgi:hypothetical protein
MGNGVGTQYCNSAGTAFGACSTIYVCNDGFNLQKGACVANACSR